MIRPGSKGRRGLPWGLATNGNGDGTSGGRDGTLVADTSIEEILDTYDRHLDEKSREDRELEERRATFRENARQLLDDVVERAMRDVGEAVLARGHAWSIEERVDLEEEPGIGCHFRPRDAGRDLRLGSDLVFRFAFPDRVRVTAIVRRGDAVREFPPRTHAMEDVDADLVREEIARFLTLVIDRAEPQGA